MYGGVPFSTPLPLGHSNPLSSGYGFRGDQTDPGPTTCPGRRLFLVITSLPRSGLPATTLRLDSSLSPPDGPTWTRLWDVFVPRAVRAVSFRSCPPLRSVRFPARDATDWMSLRREEYVLTPTAAPRLMPDSDRAKRRVESRTSSTRRTQEVGPTGTWERLESRRVKTEDDLNWPRSKARLWEEEAQSRGSSQRRTELKWTVLPRRPSGGGSSEGTEKRV